ncbi:fibrillin-2-like [Branchiostoma lanceolatum]|uniref:fibrillin-2-like n=1 Tax=Branchiostoma lanceolatum TaxID=7740 RepID=UPI003455DF19
MATGYTPDLTSDQEFRRFWICWSSGGSVAVGRGGETEPFMSWTDPQPVAGINRVGYRIGNVPGDLLFNCTQDGFQGVCFDPPTQANTTGPVCDCPYLLGENCTYPCSPGYHVISGDVITRKCMANGIWTETDLFCEDINECTTLNGGCSQTCTNTIGSYNCSCTEGFVLDLDGHNCTGTSSCSTPKHQEASGLLTRDLPEVTSSPFIFEVKVNTSGLCEIRVDRPDNNGYRFMIKSGQSRLGRVSHGAINTKATAWTPDLTSDEEFRRFWICWSRGGSVGVGRSGEGEPFISWTDPQPVAGIGRVGYRIGDVPGDLLFNCTQDINECTILNGGCSQTCTNTVGGYNCSCTEGFVLDFDGHNCTGTSSCSTPKHVGNDSNLAWDLPEITSSPFIFEVKVNTTGNVIIRLDTDDGDGYRVKIASGQSSSARLFSYTLATHSALDMTSADEFRRFWICWSKGGSVGVGRGGEVEPFMIGTDPQPLTNISKVGYRTTDDAGDFLFNCALDGFPGVCFDPPTQANTTGPVCDCPYLLGENCTYPCSPGYHVISGDVITRMCGPDGLWTETALFCEDIDECTSQNGGCNQTCTNTVGGYNCSCSEGFVLDGDEHNCTDPCPIKRHRDGVDLYTVSFDIPMVITSPFIFEVKLNTTGYCVIRLDTLTDGGYRIFIRSSSESNIAKVVANDITVFASQSTPDITSADEFRRFWICGSRGGSIGVGRDGDIEPFMSWTDPEPFTDRIIQAGYKSMHAPGDFRFNCALDGYPGVCFDPPTQANTTGPVCDCPYLLGENCSYPCFPGYYVISGDVITRTCTANGSWTDTDLICQDIDECTIQNGGCSHNCNNTAGGYNCSCTEGFLLDGDGHNCTATCSKQDHTDGGLSYHVYNDNPIPSPFIFEVKTGRAVWVSYLLRIFANSGFAGLSVETLALVDMETWSRF